MANESVDDYFALLPTHQAEGLQAVRRSLLSAFPAAKESMRLEMPTYDCRSGSFSMVARDGALHFYLSGKADGWGNHDAFTPYATEKGALVVPESEPVPVEAILSAVEQLFS